MTVFKPATLPCSFSGRVPEVADRGATTPRGHRAGAGSLIPEH